MGTIVNKDEYYRRLMEGNFVYDYPFSITEESASYFDSIIELIDSMSPSLSTVLILGRRGVGKSMFTKYLSFKRNMNLVDYMSMPNNFNSSEWLFRMDAIFGELIQNHRDENLIIDDSLFLTKYHIIRLISNIRGKLFFTTQTLNQLPIIPDLIILISTDENSLDDFYKLHPALRQKDIIVINPDSYLKPNSKEICFSRVM